ncbi:MAG: helix-turn-helix domain-containing protein [Mycobacterium sp.]
MDATTAASTIAGPLGKLGSNFYFSPQAVARGEAIGLDVVSLYGAGRASVLGGVDAEAADAIFYFFKPGMVAAVVTRGRSLASEDLIATAHLGAADDYAESTFADVDSATLAAFADAVDALAATVPSGSWPLFDGYRSAPAPTTAAARAYRAAILLRELRGGVHTDAVKACGLAPATACQFDLDNFRLHGFSDDDIVELGPEIEAQKAGAEAATAAQMSALFAPLSQTQLEAIVTGTHALAAAVDESR